MPLSFQEWLANPEFDQDRVLLADIKVYSGTVEETRYLSSAPTDGYLPLLDGAPILEQQLTQPFGGSAFATTGNLEIVNDEGDLDSWLNDAWGGRDITLKMRCACDALAQDEVVHVGKVDYIEVVNDSRLNLVFRDRVAEFDKEIQEKTVDDGDNGEKVVPLCFGEVFHIEPVLVNDTTHEYQVHDGPIESIVNVYEDFAVTGKTVTPDLANGKFTLSAKPDGVLTVHVKGAKPTTWLSKPGEIIKEIVKSYGGLTDADLDLTAFTAFDAPAPAIGIYIKDRRNIIDVLDELVLSHYDYSFWGFDTQGIFYVGKLVSPTSSLSVKDVNEFDQETNGDLLVNQLGPPRWKTTINYKPVYSTRDVGEEDEDETVDKKKKKKKSYKHYSKKKKSKQRPANTVVEIDREWIKDGYKTVEYEDPAKTTIQEKYLDAENPEAEDTLIVSEADALIAATNRQALMNTVRFSCIVTVFATMFHHRVSEVITVTDRRFGFEVGVPIVITRLAKDLLNTHCESEGWY